MDAETSVMLGNFKVPFISTVELVILVAEPDILTVPIKV